MPFSEQGWTKNRSRFLMDITATHLRNSRSRLETVKGIPAYLGAHPGSGAHLAGACANGQGWLGTSIDGILGHGSPGIL